MFWQRTLKKQIEASGVGLHGGERVRMVLRPAEADSGICFRRLDIDPDTYLRVSAEAVADTRMCSCLCTESAAGQIKISTIEHLMSALCAAGIDNVYIDLTAEEVPIFDGSAVPFLFLLNSSGVVSQPKAKKFIRILSPLVIQEQDKWVRLDPHAGYSFSFSISFEHPAIGRTLQETNFDFAQHSYNQDIARARTFGFTQEVEWLRENGLARGGGLENAIVLDEYKVLNEGGLRYNDEFVRHKILDAVGDMYVVGHPIIGAYSAHKSGHTLNNLLVRQLALQPQAWELTSMPTANETAQLKSWLQEKALAAA